MGDISYVESNGKFLVIDEKGKTEKLDSKKELDKYIKENNCKVVL